MLIKLRKLQPEDLKYFAKWWRDEELIKYTSGNFEKLSNDDVKKYFNEMINSKTDFHWMIEADGLTIGHINLSGKDNNWYETQIVIGEKDFWNRGYGSEAIKQMLPEASSLDIGQIYLEVRPENLRAIRAYEKSGFVPVGKIKHPDNPNLLETIRMEHQNTKYPL